MLRDHCGSDFLFLFLVQLSILFFDLFKGEITGWNSQCLSHHGPDIAGKEFRIVDLSLAWGVDWKVFQLGSLKQLSHSQPDDRLGSVGLFPGPEIKANICYEKCSS